MPHTPGPWRVAEGDSGIILAPSDSGRPDRYVQVIYHEDEKYTYKSPGDANLIAAAPEMYRACKHALTIVDEYENSPSGYAGTIVLRKLLEAALAKAEGRN